MVRLAAIVMAYLALATAYSLATPVGEAPDEPGHIAYIGFLQSHGRPPQHGEVDGPLALQVKHPPLYYLVASAAALGTSVDHLAFIDNPHFSVNVAHQVTPAAHGHSADEEWPYAPVYRAVRRIRLLGVLLGVIVILATYAIGRSVAPARPHLAWGAAGAVAFLPQFLFMQGVVNNDALANPLAALTLVFAARVAATARSSRAWRRDTLLLGTFAALGLVTKLSTAALVGVAALALLIGAAWPGHPDPLGVENGRPSPHPAALGISRWRRLVVGAVSTGLPILAALGWWWLANWRLTGDVLGAATWGPAADIGRREKPLGPDLPQYFWLQFTSFWGHFGWTSVPLADVVYRALSLVCLLAAAGLGVAVWRARASLRPRQVWRRLLSSGSGEASVGLVVVVAALLTYASVFSLVFVWDLAVAQGRYLFTALPALGLLFAAGLLAWLPARWETGGAAVLVLLQLALAWHALVGGVAPAFRLPPTLTREEEALVTDFRERGGGAVQFGPSIELQALWTGEEGRRNDDGVPRTTHIRPGKTLEVSLYWSAIQQPEEGYWMFVQVTDFSGRLVAQRDFLPDDGRYPTVSWVPGRAYRETLHLPMPPDMALGPAQVAVGLYPEGHPEARVPVVGRGASPDNVARIPVVVESESGGLRVPPRAALLPDVPGVHWTSRRDDPSSAIGRLRGLESSATTTGFTATVTITLYWSAATTNPEPPDDATVFVHLLDPAGRQVATADGPPFGGRFPPKHWDLEDAVPDRRHVELPVSVAGTVNSIEVGWYHLQTGERLFARVEGRDEPLPDNALRIPITPLRRTP